MSLIEWFHKARRTVVRIYDAERADHPSPRDGIEPAPIKPIEPLEEMQAEVPKIGTTDAPGG